MPPIRLIIFCLLLAAGSVVPCPGGETVKVVLTGDSTVATQYGWGNAFTRLLVPEADCVNLAQN